MNRRVCFYIILVMGIFLTACPNSRIGDDWSPSIQRGFITEGEGKNDIPAIDNPQFSKATEVNYLADTSQVLVLHLEGQTKVYPLAILHWHEVVNDQIGEQRVAITYATLSGSGIAFERVSDQGVVFDLAVSGLLYNSNLIVFDRLSDTQWLQFLGMGIKGLGQERFLKEFPIIEMNWRTCQLLFPNSEVLNTQTGYNRPYQTYPYGDYRTNDDKFLFDLTVPLESLSDVISFKEKGLGVVIAENAKVYPMTAFPTEGVGLIEDEFQGEPLIIIGSQEHGLIVAYSRKRADGSIATFELANTERITIRDERGQVFNVFGKTIEGNNAAELDQVPSKIGYWFTWFVFYPNVILFQ